MDIIKSFLRCLAMESFNSVSPALVTALSNWVLNGRVSECK